MHLLSALGCAGDGGGDLFLGRSGCCVAVVVVVLSDRQAFQQTRARGPRYVL